MDIFGESSAALVYARNKGILGTGAGAIPSPIRMTGTIIKPHWCIDNGAAFNTTATRLYFYPIWLDRIETFAGAKTYNAGGADNTETYRVGIYSELSTGGPGTLQKDFGEVTLSGAVALRTLASSWTNSYVGWHYLAVHHNTAASMYGYLTAYQLTAAGYAMLNPVQGVFGTLSSDGEFGSPGTGNQFLYVDTAYGALASTAVTPTSSTNTATAVRLYK